MYIRLNKGNENYVFCVIFLHITALYFLPSVQEENIALVMNFEFPFQLDLRVLGIKKLENCVFTNFFFL